MAMQKMKAVAVGDGEVGKTCMLVSYSTNEFPEKYVPTVYDNYAVELKVNGEIVKLSLWDTAGQEDYEGFRPLSYAGTDAFIVCFSVMNRESFANVEYKWIPEIKNHSKKAPILIVGTKTDLRDEESKSCVTAKEGEELANKLKVYGYLECSALTQKGLKRVFDEVVKSFLSKNEKKPPPCCRVL